MVVGILTIPLGYWNLDEIIGVQIGAGILLFVIIGAWMYEFLNRGLKYDVPMFGSDPASQIGTCVFNYAFIVTVPSWVNEKKAGISINKSIWAALIPSIISFTMIGWIGALAIKTSTTTDLLASLSTPETSTVAQIATYLFPWAALVSGIPILSIVIRYNLIENKVCDKRWGNFWSVIFPWIVAACLDSGKLYTCILFFFLFLLYRTMHFNIIFVLFRQLVERCIELGIDFDDSTLEFNAAGVFVYCGEKKKAGKGRRRGW